jgi:hypothetical protein
MLSDETSLVREMKTANAHKGSHPIECSLKKAWTSDFQILFLLLSFSHFYARKGLIQLTLLDQEIPDQ